MLTIKTNIRTNICKYSSEVPYSYYVWSRPSSSVSPNQASRPISLNARAHPGWLCGLGSLGGQRGGRRALRLRVGLGHSLASGQGGRLGALARRQSRKGATSDMAQGRGGWGIASFTPKSAAGHHQNAFASQFSNQHMLWTAAEPHLPPFSLAKGAQLKCRSVRRLDSTRARAGRREPTCWQVLRALSARPPRRSSGESLAQPSPARTPARTAIPQPTRRPIVGARRRFHPQQGRPRLRAASQTGPWECYYAMRARRTPSEASEGR